MKKTGTTIFTLALALILVSTLSSGVILADDDDDDDKKKRYKTVKVIDVVILDCGIDPTGFTMNLIVTGFDSSTDEKVPEIAVGMDTCTVATAAMLSNKFKLKDSGHGFDSGFGTLVSRSIYVRKRKVRVER